jgi:hypothetical protein
LCLKLLERILVPRPEKLWHIIEADRRKPMDQAEQAPMFQTLVQRWKTYTHADSNPWLRSAWVICCLVITVDVFLPDAFSHQHPWLRWLLLCFYLLAIPVTWMLLRDRRKREDRPETS